MSSAILIPEPASLQSVPAARHLQHPRLASTGPRLAPIVAGHDVNWIILRAFRPKGLSAPLPGAFGTMGLWKPESPANPDGLTFEVPAAVCEAIDEEPTRDLPGVCPGPIAEWAHASLVGELPPAWIPPARELVESWLPPGALTLRLGPLLRQVDLVLSESRWALRLALISQIPAGLPANRLRCLRELAVDAQTQWRMVRVCLVEGAEGRSLCAEVDLTGALLAESLFLASLDGLKNVAAWIAEMASLLTDVTVTIRSLEIWQEKPTRKKPRKEQLKAA